MLKEIIGAVIKGISGAVTTKIIDKNKEENEKRERIFENRPEMEIVDFKDYISRTGYGIKKKCDIELFVARIEKIDFERGLKAVYKNEDFNQDEWCCVIYTIKNTGKTDVSILDIISCDKKSTCIFPSANATDWASSGLINYSKRYDKKIHIGESITLKLCYHKECIVTGLFTASILIGLQDRNGRYWQQCLFAPSNKIQDSFSVEPKEYINDLRNDDAIKYFKDVYMRHI